MPTYSLSQFNTFKLAINAKQLLSINNISDLDRLLPIVEPVLVLGSGSNMLFTQDFDGIVLHNKLKGIEITEDSDNYYLQISAGENWHDLVMNCAEQGIGGLENLALIPGTVGAAPVQNIGAYGVELANLCVQVQAYNLITGQLELLDNSQCLFGYRDSIFKHQRHYFITGVKLQLAKCWQPQLSYGELNVWVTQLACEPCPLDVANKVIAVREQKLPDPNVIPNVGSFFKNPIVPKNQALRLKSAYPDMPQYPANDQVKLAAGWLIDHLGLKGFSIGGAAIHSRQALVLVNSDHATPSDVVNLAAYIRQQVKIEFDVSLEVEVNFVDNTGYSDLDKALTYV